MTNPEILPFQDRHLPEAVRLSAHEGWPHKADDWALVAAISHAFVACEGEKTVGTAFCTPFGDDVAMINMIIVDETMRGRGLGRRLMETVMAQAGERELRLTATAAGLPLYTKLGFVQGGRILQHQGEIGAIAAPEDVKDAASEDWEAIVALDRAATGADRSSLFARLRAVGETVVTRGPEGRVSGFAICRPFGRGYVVGPAAAADVQTAERLIAAHLHRHPGSFMRVDTTAESGLAPWLAAQGLPHVGGGVAMTCRSQASKPQSPPSKDVHTFALAAQALG
ncbi:GNAT family N-acetyltransferase [Jiella sp. 40Bstr34]|uniref:GNAT family N-acetyltransferase n=2 Tax=Jiella pacifica TaxID=2696469 RepID=A0A6N9T970_9HYPH|nr:GNAT family N-acetyltransferase [Jiella pacifica]NDW06596.1 GNAT family N-acetyltransferase [Jiella pacifica]